MSLSAQQIVETTQIEMLKAGTNQPGLNAQDYWASLVESKLDIQPGQTSPVQKSDFQDADGSVLCRLRALIDYFIALGICDSVSEPNRPACQLNALNNYNNAIAQCDLV